MPATDAMMPELPEPLEALLWDTVRAVDFAAQACVRDPANVAANHAAFEAERALRVALLETLAQRHQERALRVALLETLAQRHQDGWQSGYEACFFGDNGPCP